MPTTSKSEAAVKISGLESGVAFIQSSRRPDRKRYRGCRGSSWAIKMPSDLYTTSWRRSRKSLVDHRGRFERFGDVDAMWSKMPWGSPHTRITSMTSRKRPTRVEPHGDAARFERAEPPTASTTDLIGPPCVSGHGQAGGASGQRVNMRQALSPVEVSPTRRPRCPSELQTPRNEASLRSNSATSDEYWTGRFANRAARRRAGR